MRIRILPEFLCLLYVHSCLGDAWLIIEDVGLEHEYSEAVLNADAAAEVTGSLIDTPRLAAEGISPFACSSLLRLCCLVHAARTSQSFMMNYASGVLGSVYEGYKVVFDKPRLSESLGPPVVGCVVNRESVHEERFYLRSHPDRSDAVFVFVDVGESGKYEITPTQLVSDLHFTCKYAPHFI